MHRDKPKLKEFISESIAMNEQLLQQQEVLGQEISRWNHYCQMSDKITNQVVDLQSGYDEIDK